MLSASLYARPMHVLAGIGGLGLLLAGIAVGCSSTPSERVGITGSGGSGLESDSTLAGEGAGPVSPEKGPGGAG